MPVFFQHHVELGSIYKAIFIQLNLHQAIVNSYQNIMLFVLILSSVWAKSFQQMNYYLGRYGLETTRLCIMDASILVDGGEKQAKIRMVNGRPPTQWCKQACEGKISSFFLFLLFKN